VRKCTPQFYKIIVSFEMRPEMRNKSRNYNIHANQLYECVLN